MSELLSEFIPLEEALALKELGYNGRCFGYYADKTGEDRTIYTVSTTQGSINSMSVHFNEGSPSYQFSAPTYRQAFKWFRDTHGFIGVPTISNYSDDRYVFDIFQKFNDEIYFEGSDLTDSKNGNKEYHTVEEAELACLRKLIEIVLNNK